ncbi:hypothetical protein C1631_012965 [Chryseobacterium phosphatilyticum]|uniref:Glycoside hydrolase family 19 catalytic domain-containing protein n=1 Tax=Chryseobacterium phosphatilyticum TaxID=475075 RepID=A0A316X8C2_9FLAO|nr:hypothetical protein [Chryseobacterium phosphatilyticum]PWN68976.1 hypothetical protein C1631_012965 [Chryseobacterium phosphatilyticum]
MDRLKNDGEGDVPETHNQTSAQNQMKADNQQKMDDQRAENEEKDKKEEGLLLAIDGAKIKFNAHMGTFKVLSNVPTTQDKLTGTIVEKQIPNFIFDDGFQMIALTEWQDFGTAKVQENYVLLKKSTLPGTGKMPGSVPPETGKIEFVTSGQVNAPESIDAKGAPVPEQKEDKRCYCDRDLTIDELKLIIKQLRASEKKNSTAIFDDENCPLQESDKTDERLLVEINAMFKTYHINTCIRKIHFFAQCYHETARLGTTLEYASGVGYDPGNHPESKQHGHTEVGDGPRYKGRGAMQLTWRDQQKEYFSYVISKKLQLLQGKKIDELFNRKKQYQEKYIYTKIKFDKDGKPVLDKKKRKIKEKVVDLIDVDSAGLLANNLFFAIDSAGWFWDIYKTIEYSSKANKTKYREILHKNLNEVSDYGDKYLSIISKFVNGGGNGMAERNVYYNELKTNVFKFNTNCINRDKIKK